MLGFLWLGIMNLKGFRRKWHETKEGFGTPQLTEMTLENLWMKNIEHKAPG
jgi:hypothetical protein